MAQPTKSNTQILQELETLSHSLHQSRRTASLVLPRSEVPRIEPDNYEPDVLNLDPGSRRISLSPWQSKTKLDHDEKSKNKWFRNWKPIRALTHISMQKLTCLFSVEVVAVQGLPASMNGLRLSVRVRKKETKDGSVQTMPCRVSEGVADFEETLFVRCHVYFTPGSGTQMRFEPRPFLISVVAVDVEELNFGKSVVDLSSLIQESIEKSFEGTRINQWDISFDLYGKAKGSELVLKLGFQIMEKDRGIGIYSQVEGQKTGKNRNHSISLARRQSKTSFSIPSPRLSSRRGTFGTSSERFQVIGDDLNNNLHDQPSSSIRPASRQTTSDNDNGPFEFEVLEKGIEFADKDYPNSDKRSVSSEVVKEVVHDRYRTELDSISQQIKALESIIGDEYDQETKSQILDAEEDKVRREFLQMLDQNIKNTNDQTQSSKFDDDNNDDDNFFIPDLGKGLGPVVQTRNGGFLAAINPTETKVARTETPKLAIQISKPLVIEPNAAGFELLQKLASTTLQELTSDLLSSMPLDDLTGKTPEKIAFEGIASAIIHGRNKEGGGATSTATKTITAVKSMATALTSGRKERALTGIWNVNEEPLKLDEILAFSLQRIENLSIDCLKIQADMFEDAPFHISPLVKNRVMENAVPVEDWSSGKSSKPETVTVSVRVQLRDPVRQYEAVGGPLMVLIHASECDDGDRTGEDERRYKVGSLQVGGVKVGSGSREEDVWDSEKQKVTALQWLIRNGMGIKGGKKMIKKLSKGEDFIWSLSSRIVADMWLKAIRNPDVKFNKI